MEITIINHEEVEALLDYRTAVEVLENAFVKAKQGQCLTPPRTPMVLGEKKMFGSMAGYVAGLNRVGQKVNTVFPVNSGTRYHIHQGAILLFDTETGCLLAVIEAAAVTNIRTAAASALATKLLAGPELRTVAIIGAGTQGRQHLQALAATHPLKGGYIWDISPAQADKLAQWGRHHTGLNFKTPENLAQAVEGSDLICICTPATTPVLRGEWLQPGTHINSVGFSGPQGRELDDEVLKKSKIYVDWLETIMYDCGDIIRPLAEGLISREDILGDFGDMVTSGVPLRQSPQDITLFKATGVAIEDIACADYLFQKAQREGRGKSVKFGGFSY